MNARTKKNAASPPPAVEAADRPLLTWSIDFRRLVSGLLLIHVMALFVGPCASPPPSSEWARQAEALYGPYLHATFLKDHGYRFFAPNPGPSHLVRYELLDADDQEIGEGRFPDLNEHWPRLLYHRHFMISESLYNVARIPPGEPQPNAPLELRTSHTRAVALRDTYLNSIARYIARQNPEAAQVRIVMVEHAIPLPEDVVAGRPLSDEGLYQEVVLGVYTVQEEDHR